MQLGLVLLLVDVLCIVHAAKTRRFWPWGVCSPSGSRVPKRRCGKMRMFDTETTVPIPKFATLTA
jgi:hypothetical protein